MRHRLGDVAPHLSDLDQVQPPLWLNGQYFKVCCTSFVVAVLLWSSTFKDVIDCMLSSNWLYVHSTTLPGCFQRCLFRSCFMVITYTSKQNMYNLHLAYLTVKGDPIL